MKGWAWIVFAVFGKQTVGKFGEPTHRPLLPIHIQAGSPEVVHIQSPTSCAQSLMIFVQSNTLMAERSKMLGSRPCTPAVHIPKCPNKSSWGELIVTSDATNMNR